MSACFGENPELWFATHPRNQVKAKAICGRCPIRQQCLEHALKHRIKDGIWGGLTRAERDKLTRRPAKPRAKSTLPVPPPSEIRGVSWAATKGCWAVTIRHGGRTHWVGSYAEQTAAEAAAIAKCQEFGIITQRRNSGHRRAA